jgi:hypothetical protein
VTNTFSQLHGVWLSEVTKIAINGGHHTLAKFNRKSFARLWQKALLTVDVTSSASTWRQISKSLRSFGNCAILNRLASLSDDLFENIQSGTHDSNHALPRQPMVRIGNNPQEISAMCYGLQHYFMRMQAQCQCTLQKADNALLLEFQAARALTQNNQIIDVADIDFGFQLVFDVVVQRMQVDMAKKLAGQCSSWQALTGRCVKQGLMCWHLRAQAPVTTKAWGMLQGVLRKTSAHHLVQLQTGVRAQLQALKVRLPQSPQLRQNTAGDVGKERLDIRLAIKRMPLPARTAAESINGRMGASPFSVSETVVYKDFVNMPLNLPYESVLRQPISKAGRKYLVQFGFGYRKHRKGLRPIVTRRQLCGQRQISYGKSTMCSQRSLSPIPKVQLNKVTAISFLVMGKMLGVLCEE